MKIRKAIRFLKFLEQDEKFLKKKFIKKEAAGGGGGGGVARGASTGAASVSDLGKTPSPALAVVNRPGSSYALDVPTIPKRKKKKGYERS